jgi:hypothetical protein
MGRVVATDQLDPPVDLVTIYRALEWRIEGIVYRTDTSDDENIVGQVRVVRGRVLRTLASHGRGWEGGYYGDWKSKALGVSVRYSIRS